MRNWNVLAVAVLLLAPGLAGARDGDLDHSFGTLGKQRIAAAGSSDIAPFGAALAIQPDGKMVLAGSRFTIINNLYDYDFCGVRLNPDGTRDAGFGTAGEVDIAFNRGGTNEDTAHGVVLQSDGKIIVVGESQGDASTGADIAAIRLNPNGGIDQQYGSNGKAIVRFNLGPPTNVDDFALSATLDSQGRLLISGYSTAGSTPAYPVMTLVRLDANGVRDTSFSTDGRVTFGSAAAPAAGARVRELANHKILVSGYTIDPATQNADLLLVRFNADGALDSSFGVGGAATYAFDIGGTRLDAALDITELADGSILAAGAASVSAPSNLDFALVKFTASGTLFPGFAPRIYPLDSGGGFSDIASSMAVDHQGRILLAGQASTGTVDGADLTDFAVLRALPDGQPDPAFGINGHVIRSSAWLFAPDLYNRGTAIALDAQQHVVIAGTSAYTATDTYRHAFAVLRTTGDTVFSDGFGS